jgi:hypothetical protein
MPATNPRLTHQLRIGIIATIIAGGILLLAPGASSQSVTPQSVDPMQHFIDCAGVLITAPDVHAANCLPSNIAPETKSLASSPDDAVGCQYDDAVEDLDNDCRGQDFPDDTGGGES